MSRRGDESWRRAAQHPVRTLSLQFAIVGLGLGGYFYWRTGSVAGAVVVALLCGTAVTMLGLKQMRRVDAGLQLEPPKRASVGSLLPLVAGAALIVWGAATGSWGLVVAGVPLLCLGLALVGLRVFLARRAER